MSIPPGYIYIASLLPYFLLPSAFVYGFLAVGQHYFDTHIPSWIIAIISLIARPTLFYGQGRYRIWRNKKEAAAHGAVLLPRVLESPSAIVNKAVQSVKNGYPLGIFDEWAKEYGNAYRLGLLSEGVVLTTEPEHIKAILATQFESFEKGPVFRDQMQSLLGSGIFNADGDLWKFHRGMTRPFFSRERISDFDIYDRNCDLAISQSRKRLAEGYSIDFQDLVGRFTLDSASEFLFGHNVRSLSAGIPYPPNSGTINPPSFYEHPSHDFLAAFTEGQVASAVRTNQGPNWPLFEMKKDKVKPLRKVIDNFTAPLLEKALAQKEQKSSEKYDEDNLLAHLVNHTQDRNILKDELVNLLVAGRDTTMSLLTFSMYMLTQHPDIERRLRQEIYEKVGPTGRPNYESMRDLRYTKAFLNEVLRLYPSVPGDGRTSNKAVVFPAKGPNQKPIYIPAKTNCGYIVINMHRRTDLWGPDALTFDPDRFLDERLHKYLIPNPYIFCPFNAGPRICLGQQFAYHEATFYLVRLLQQFTEFTLDDANNVKPPADWAGCDGLKGKDKIVPGAHLTLYVKGGLWVKMKEVKSADV